jgi:hypothetical protein
MSEHLFRNKPNVMMEESYSWLTDILESYSGNEQRIQIRKAPRQNLEWRVSCGDPVQYTRMKSLILGNMHNSFTVPLWHEAQFLDEAVSVDQSVISVDTRYHDFREDGYVVLWKDSTFCEVKEITSLTNSSLSLDSGTLFSYTAIDYIMPAKKAWLFQPVDFTIYPDDMQETVFSWNIENNRALTELLLDMQYKERDVLVNAFDITGEGISKKMSRATSIIDYETGAFTVFSRLDWSTQSIDSLAFYLRGQEDIFNFKRWLHTIKGRYKSFWVPNHQFDFTPISLSGTSLAVQNIGYTSYLQDNPVFKHVAFYKYDGTVTIREIMSATQNSYTQETLTLDSSAGVSLDDVKYICFTGLYRMNSDRIEISWQDHNEANIVFSVVGVKE